MSERSTFLNAVIGAAVTVVFAFLPFSPVLGGAVAGYLQRDDYREGGKVGAISGVLATIPIAIFVTFVAAFFTIVPAVGGRMGVGIFFGFLFVVVATLFLLYTVGLSALGGVLGIVLAEEFRGESKGDEWSRESEYVEPPIQTEVEEELDQQDEI